MSELEEISNEIRESYKGIISDNQIEATIRWWEKFLIKHDDALIEAVIVELGKMESSSGIKMFGGEARTFILAAYAELKGEMKQP